MNIFALASLSVSVCCFTLAIFILRVAKTKTHKIWAFFNLAVCLWAINLFFVAISNSPYDAGLSWRRVYGLGIFVPITFYHFIHSFCELKKSATLKIGYIVCLLSIPISFFAPNFINEVDYVFGSFYYSKATVLLNILILYVGIFVWLSFFTIVQYLREAKGNKRLQALYILGGFGLGWAGGISTFLPHYNVLIYPVWHSTICIYTILMTYAIFKYQLMDIKVAVTRIGVFVLVYTLILGIPFGITYCGKDYLINLLGETWYWTPLIITTLFATAGPFIYLYLQKKAEERLLQEERRIQQLLTDSSYGMRTIKDLDKLLAMILELVLKTLKVTNASIYLLDARSVNMLLK